MCQNGVAVLLLTAASAFNIVACFDTSPPFLLFQHAHRIRAESVVLFAKSKRGIGSSGAAVGIKGFGGTAIPKGKGEEVELDKSNQARAFYDYLDKHDAGDNLKRVALGFFPLPHGGGKLRGVVAMKNFKKGDVIIRIPFPMAVNLGVEGEDPSMPGLTLLRDCCSTRGLSGFEASTSRQPYYDMLPPFKGDDCLGSTDFFSDQALEALQSPLIVQETVRRRERVRARFNEFIQQSTVEKPLTWTDGSTLQEEHLRWAVWLITSRVLTVRGDEAEGRAYRLLIPLLDMCNHDRKSPHVLTGRAVSNGELKVVAGSPVSAGEQINICYGGGVAGNDRFIQDYGFLDDDGLAYDLVAQQLLGKRRLVEGSSAGRLMTTTDRSEAIASLATTTIEEDEALLSNETDPAVRCAIQFRLGVKRALAKQPRAV
jgi:hypothetical protein